MQSLEQWFYLENGENKGPIRYDEMIALRQTGAIIDTTLVWSSPMDEWVQLGTCVEFSGDRIKNIYYERIFATHFRPRQNSRRLAQTSVLIHNDRRLSVGETLTMSAQGALIVVKDPTLMVGEPVTLHFKKSDQVNEAMNCRAIVLEKKISGNRKRSRRQEATRYVVRFDGIFHDRLTQTFFANQDKGE